MQVSGLPGHSLLKAFREPSYELPCGHEDFTLYDSNVHPEVPAVPKELCIRMTLPMHIAGVK